MLHFHFLRGLRRSLVSTTALSACLLALSCHGQSSTTQSQAASAHIDSTTLRGDTLELIFAGDIMTHGPQIRAAAQSDGSYDFAQSFSLVRPVIERADLAIGNLETTFGGKPYSGYPMFSSPEALAVALREAGFDVLTTSDRKSVV